MIIEQRPLADGRRRVAVSAQHRARGRFELLILHNDEACYGPHSQLIEVYESSGEASTAARHFAICYEIALTEGFILNDDMFVNLGGSAVSLAEALVTEEDPEVFRTILRKVQGWPGV